MLKITMGGEGCVTTGKCAVAYCYLSDKQEAIRVPNLKMKAMALANGTL